MIEWWLDGSGYPRLLWALLRVCDHGEVTLLDADGRLNGFESYEEAAAWLSEDEYERLDDLDADDLEALGAGEDGLTPPEGQSYAQLVAAMKRAVDIGA